jgi:hypothetical protein
MYPGKNKAAGLNHPPGCMTAAVHRRSFDPFNKWLLLTAQKVNPLKPRQRLKTSERRSKAAEILTTNGHE